MRITRNVKGVLAKGMTFGKYQKEDKKIRKQKLLAKIIEIYKEVKPDIVSISKYGGAVLCEYPTPSKRVKFSKNECSAIGVRLSFHRLTYIAIHKKALSDKLEIYHTCGDKFCCKPSHLIIGPKGVNLLRKGCKGYIRLSKRDDQGEERFIRVCNHHPPCSVVTEAEDIKKNRVGTATHEDCMGFLRYKGKLYRTCKQTVSGCATITDFTKDMMCGRADIGRVVDVKKSICITPENFFTTYVTSKSDEEDEEEDEEQEENEENEKGEEDGEVEVEAEDDDPTDNQAETDDISDHEDGDTNNQTETVEDITYDPITSIDPSTPEAGTTKSQTSLRRKYKRR